MIFKYRMQAHAFLDRRCTSDARSDAASAETEHEVEGRLLLDVVVRQGKSILELLAREDQTLLVRRDALLGYGCCVVRR